MRENVSRFSDLTCRLTATRFIVSLCCVFFAATAAVQAATDFSDYSGFSSASSTTVSTIKIGSTTDSETSITANTTATGDDTTGSDDEDGVTVPSTISVVSGTSGSLTVNVTNTSGATVFLNAWIDFNRNGVLTDSGEQIATNSTIATGTSNSNKTVNFTVPSSAVTGTAGVRVRLTSTSSPGSTGLSGNGEVEDYVTTLVCPTVSLTPSSLPNAYASSSYSQTFAASGGTSPYTYAVSSGTLPSGLSLSSGGVLSGTPSAGNGSGTSITVRATDAKSCQGTLTYNVQVCPVISVSPTSLSNGMLGLAYNQTIAASGGASSYTYAITSGSLPGGLSLNTSSGVISGTPTSTSAATFTVGVTDANACVASRSYTITPAAATDYGDYASFGSVSSLSNSNLRIGATVDSEASATTNSTATGDDTTGSDDEDGVTIPASLMRGLSNSITVNVTNAFGASAYLNAWIDYNQNGVLTDSGEQIATNTLIANGTSNSNKTITFTVPAGATVGITGLRVRLSSTASPGSTGASGTGEIEDYTVSIASGLSIGNMIWNDANENGLFDPGESGIDNVLVELWTPGADNAIGGTGSNADTKVTSVTSSGGGLYNFTGLSAGYYYVKVPTPPLSRTSLVVDNTDNGQDGDNNASQPGGSGTAAFSPVIQLVVGTEPGSSGSGNIDNTIDFGFAANIGSPFVCDNRFYIIQNVEGTPGAGDWDTTLYYIDTDQTLVPIFVFDGKKLNGLVAYGGYLYCVDQAGGNLYRINSLGVLVDMGQIAGIPNSATDGQWGGGTALTSGLMIINRYTFSNAQTTLYTIDLTSATMVGSPVVTKYASTGANTTGNFGDIVWDPLTSKIYGYNTNDTSNLGLHEINTTTGMCTRVAASSLSTFGSLVIDANGLAYGYGSSNSSTSQDTLYVFNRTNGILNGTVSIVGSGPVVTNSDGAACPGAAPSMQMGNLVWNDANNNGLKDSGEAGIDGVTLQLFLGGQNPLTASPAATTTTAGGGLYSFNNLSPGQYFIYMPTPPAAYPLSSTTTATTDNNVDNDDNGIQTSQGLPVQSPLIALAGGTEPTTDGDTDSNTNLTIDFGFVACPAITVSPTSIAAAAVGASYSQTFTASGGTTPYTWSVSTGTLPAGLTLNSSTGVLSGIPTSSTATSFTIRATDKNGCLGTRAFTLTPACNTINVTPSTLPDATVGTAYSQTFSATGGNGTYSWAVSSGTLPAGLTLSTAGVLSGTPTAGNGSGVNLTFRVTDSYGCQQTATINLQVCPVLALAPTTLPTPTVGSLYSQTITASGGASSYSFSLANGTLPMGLALSSSGAISGTPTNTTSATFTVRATDANACVGTRAYTVAAACPTITVTPTTLPDSTIGTAYSQTLTASGGTANYTWAVSSGTLPAGLSLSTSGVISGTPTTANGTGVNVTFRATDAYGCQGTATIGMQVCPVVVVSPTTLPAAIQGAPYSQTITSSGGASSYSYSITSGSLPAGLTLSTGGVISGTPTATGTSNFTVQSMDANGCPGTRALSITSNLPVTDFGDYPSFAAASQIASTEIKIGANATDAEPVNPTTGSATADDTTGSDDEELVIPSVVSGGDLNLDIPVTLSGGVTLGRIGVWADWNGDGDVADANETVLLSSSSLIGGSNTITATFKPPAGTSIGTKYLRMIVVEGTTAPSFSGTSSLKGEVEDYAITVTTPTLDYGDLPDTIIGTSAGNYQTYSNDNGPASTANSRLRLGAAVDAEGNGQPNSTATGDGSDDDGVATLPTLTQNLPATLTVTATNTFGSAGFLKAWIDWNNDGNLSADEELDSEISVPNNTSNGSFSFNFTVPSYAVLGSSLGLRVRLASVTIPASNGVVGTGEVEDYLVTVNASTVDFGDYPNFPSASRVASTLIKVGTAATDVETSNPTTGNATVDDTTGTDDEDLTMPTLQAGITGTLSIPVTLVSPVTTGRIAVFADWNGDNDVLDTNETVSLSTASLVTGTNTITATLSPPLGITGGSKFLRIVVTEGTTAPTFSGSSALRGEVEDYAVTVNAYTLDYGDLPDTGTGTSTGNYATLSSRSGPSHTVNATTLRLGATVDAEADGQPNSTATGDGADEDGISNMPVFNRGQSYTIPVSVFNNSGSTARIFGFIDWNNDGDFLDAGEALTAVTVSSSASQQSINVTGTTPGSATLGTFGARFRLATATTLTSTGTTADGEVEDYIVTGACPTISITPSSLPATTQYASYNQTLSASNGSTPYTWTIATGALPSGLALSSSGALTGTVISASGAYVFTARVTDANGCTASQSYTISVGSGGMSVGNIVFLDENNNGLKDSNERGIPNVPVEIWSAGADGKVNSADDQPVTSGNASVLTSGGMLSAGSFGTIASGFSTLTARTDWTGAYQFTELPTGVFYLKITPPNKTVFSSKYGTGSTTYSLNLDFPLASSTAVLTDNGIDNDNNGVQTTGSFSSSADAVVAGVGAAVFSMPFTLATATEPGTSNLGSDEYTIDIGLRPCPAIGVSPITVPSVSSGVAYSTTLSSAGGVAPYTYAITQGTLPSGLSLSTAGVISGTTSTTGTSAVTVRATDARGCVGFTTIQVSVTSAMSITTASLPNGTEGTAYTTTTLAATGATAPYQNWRVSSGTLPTGLAVNSSTGVVSGTPTAPGTYVFTVAVDDASVTPASVTVTNGSVETDAWSAVTFTPRTTVTGWTLGNSALTGTTTAVQLYGINDTTNSIYGATPAGAQYLASPFVASWASQTVSGFTVGRPYTLRVRYAMRAAFAHPSTSEAQPPFYGDNLWISGYNASAAGLFGPVSVNFPEPTSANYDNWATLEVPFVPQTSSMVFAYGLDGAAIDDVQFIPTVAGTATASKQFTVVISGNRDWGDLQDTGIGTGAGNYQTTSSDSGPSHYRNSNLRLGATLDIESEGLPSAAATGDDLNGTDDEDAIATLPVFARGQTYTVPVSVFNNTGTSANVFAFIDWNNDGDFLDPSEALSSVSVSSSASQQSVNVIGTVPGNAVLSQVGFRVRLSTASSLGAFGLATNGEVEDYLITPTCPAVALSPASLANGTLSAAYSQTVTASGGTAPYTFALSSGTLPSGVTLNASTGALSGTPNVAGTYTFTLTATDANGCSGTADYSVVMGCPTLAITPTSPTAGTVGTAYSQTLSASGGASPYGSWTVTSGTLPAGLSLSSAGVISGTPTAGNGSGTSVTVRTTDANGCQSTQVITLKICPVITLTPTTLTAAVANSAYSQTITASGSATAYNYTVSSGTLPSGLTLSSAGVLSGTPTSTTSRTFTITATDANGCPGSRSYTLAPTCPVITVTPATATRATVGSAYSQTLSATGGLAPYGSWTITSGTLPAGLSLNASSGVISGTPTTANGTGASVTFRTTDANGCTGSQAVTLQICPVISVSPSTLPNGTINTSYSQTITATGGTSPYSFAVSSGTLPAGLTLSSAGALSGTPTSTSSASFTITATDANGCSSSLAYTITPAPDSDYGDHSLFSNASSRMNSTLRIGALTDVEATATTNATATGDDITGSDDEDGVTLPASITQGGASSLTVNVTNTSGATSFLNVWIDFNQNGSLSDAGEQVATNTVIPTGTSNSNKTVSFTAPASALLGSAGVRVRLTSTASPGPTGASGNGEVEDNVATIVAPTTDYGDFSLFADAYSTGSTTIRLGILQDLEGSATKDSSATGDDNTGTDDEDAVTFPSMTAGQPMTLPVTVTNTSGATAYLNAWIDYNNNGVLTDAGEQIATNVNIVTGTNGGTVNLNFTVPTNAVTAASLIGTRFRLTNVQTPGSTGGVGIGEVEDHAVVILAPLTDFGDFSGAPSVSNTASTNLRLGSLVDTEYAATTNATATGDDLNGVDDEDGVTLPSMTAGAPATIPVVATNNTGSSAYLNAWIDYNNNGVFTDAGEQIATNISVTTGTTNSTINISTTVPPAAVTGTSLGVRARLSNDISPGSTGAGGVGEVEDYVVTIAAPTTDFGDYSLFSPVSSTVNSRLRLGALVDTEFAATTNATATGDDITGVDDEDSITFPSMIAGAPANVTATVTNTTGSTAYLSAWIDFNGNGVLTDAGEQIAASVAIATGTSNSAVGGSISIPATALTGVPLGARVILSSLSSGASSGNVGTGEIEDYVVTITAPTTDFGDFSSFADASQGVSPSLRMGASVDAEYAATKNATATGDDVTGLDDEDGVTLPSMSAGQTLTIPVVASNSTGAMGYLNAWIDFNNNGVLTDSGEQIATNVNVPTGTTDGTFNLSVSVPITAVTGTNLGARFRLSAPTSPGPTGANAAVGEIEDYVVNIAPTTTDFGDHSNLASASSTANANLLLGAMVDVEFSATTNVTATGDDTTGSDDEDGVTVPATITPGTSVTLPVTLQNKTNASAWLHAWIDFNNDGVLNDSTISNGGERLEAARVIPKVTTGTILREYWTGIGGTAVSDLTSNAAYPNSPTGSDYRSNFTAPTDWADNMGQRMRGWVYPPVSGAYTFWVSGDDETQLFLSTDATAANAALIARVPGWTNSQVWTTYAEQKSVTITLEAGKPYYIEALMKEGGGGDNLAAAWQLPGTSTGPVVIDGQYLAPWSAASPAQNNQQVTFTVPFTASPGTNRAVRFRLTDSATTGPTGASGTGEVEDYAVGITSPTNDFGDFSGVASASNGMSSSLFLGTLVDAEFTGTTNATATGDDITGIDDEDGVTLPALTASGTFTIPVVVTNTSGAAAFLNAWIDFNNNGVFTDAGEQFVTNVSVANGSNNVTLNQSITVPLTAVTGTNLGVRFRLTTTSSPGATGNAGGNGEVEDYVANIAAPTTDFGDLSTLASASSTTSNAVRIGALVDAEYAATTNSTATGDDITNTDDEDGVTLPSMTAGAPATIPVVVTNTSGSTVFLNAWIDYNNNGVLTDAGEQIATNTPVATGSSNVTQNLNITASAAAVTGTPLGVRVRLTSVSSPGATGAAGTGEVEDYVVTVASPPLDYGDWSGIADAASNATTALRLGALVDTEYVSTRNSSATGDDITGSDDEDGVTLPSLTAGAPATIPVSVTNTTGSTAFLNAWIDYNNNNALTDAGEQIASNVVVPTGTSNATLNLNITIPASAVTGSNIGLRFRLTNVASPGITGTVGNGEVEDYVTTIAVPTTDFGDWDGAADASSIASSNLRLGALADTEYVSTLNATATGDDTTGSDDEDGVTIPSQVPGTAGSATVVVTNNSGAAGYLNAWIDFNNNGSFTDSGEQIATNTSIASGTNGATQTVNFIVPVGAVPGQRGARFRLTSTQSPTSIGASGTGEVEDYLVTITCLPIVLSPTTLNTPTVGTAFSQSVSATGGLAPYTYSIGTGTLPAGLTLSSTGTLSGTPTSSSAATFSIVATDSYGCTGSQSYTVTPVCPTITVNPSTLPSASISTAYSQTLTASGGTAPYTYAITSGTLPAGLTLNTTSGISAGLISGTPTASNGSGVSVTFRATDANGCSGTRTITLIVCPVITLTPSTLPTPVVGTAYSQTLAGSGGAASYSFALASGSLPAWATLSPSGVLSGTPTNTTSATFTVRATDSNGCSGTLSYTITPVCPTITITPASLTQGTVGTAYSQTLAATGGTAPYSSWTVTSGTLPAGLTLNASTGVISGTPTASASPATTIGLRVTDANGCQGTRSVTLQVCPVITLSPTTLPAPVIGTAYSQSITATGGTASYTYTLASGTLPAWATLSSAGVITGTPTNGTPATVTVRATDANGCAGTLVCTLAPNCPTIGITPTTSAQGTVGSAYSQTLTATGGTAPYSSWTVTSGTLPAGLTLNSSTGVISGTPTTSNGMGVNVSIRANDANGCQGTQAILFQICPVISLSPTTPATPVVSTAYSQTFTATGGSGSYNYTLASGTLPTWATLSTSGVLTGTPDSPNSATFTLRATDANGCSGTQTYTITPACPTMSISPLTAAVGTVGSSYSQALSGSGGTAPYGSWTVTSGTLPAGLSLSSSGTVSGTPTASTGAATSFVVRTTDARGCQISATISMKVCPVVTVNPTTLPASTAGSSYSQTITGSGGVSPYTFTVSSGTLPAGLTLSSAGALTGTPTATTSATFIVTATDANGCPGSRTYSMTPACPTITVTPATLPNGTVNSAYSQTVTSTGGVGTVTFSISSGSLPAGLSLNSASGLISGTPTSTAAATFTVRATDSNGCTGTTSYTVTPACPTITVSPATLNTGGVGIAYSQTLSGTGGIAPYSAWTVTSGTLPAGLSLNSSTGVISGTPTTSNGTGVNVTIRTTDANGCQGSSVVSIKICPVITQSPSTLATPVTGVAYSQTITPAGGVAAYTFTLASGALPSGLTLSSSGTISGTTTSTTPATFTVRATAADGCSGTASYTLTPVCPTLALTPTGALPAAYLGAPYTQALTASGGTAPYTFSLQSGDLPGGVLLSSSGTLSGTPTAKGSFPVTVRVADANACAQTFNLTLQVHTLSIGNLVFEDSNNNGLKDSGEPGVAGALVQLFTTGTDNAIGGSGGAADTQVGADFTTTSSGAYLFDLLPAGNYYVKVTPPADYLFTGGTAATTDNNVDNNNDGSQPGGSGTPLFSPVILLSGGAESITDGDTDPDTNLTVDFGLWSSVAVGNFIFLDINGDGVRNEGESLGNIYVELYAQGATPGVSDPISAGTSGCSCKGRYYLEGINPGTYFLHIPASQFTTGSPLEGLLPMSSVVAGDDDSGQDLLFNNNPAVNGASTGLFTLRPGQCPTGSAESGAEGNIDDAIDARVDLTRDLGIVAPAGTGFAASEAIRRYIVTGGFTASVLPGATTFALWSQDSGIGKATDDPDEDGIANLMEYALGTDPASPLQPNRFTLTHDAATGSLTALLTQPTSTHDDLIVTLETLTDLSKAANAAAWKKLSMAATTTINADGTLTRAYSNLEKLLVFKGLDSGLLRLRVDLDANRDGVAEATTTSAIQGWGRQTFATGSRTFSMPLLNAAFFTGKIVSASANELMLPAILTLPAGSLYLEVLDGTLAGQRFDIDSTASSGNTIVLQNTSQSYAGLVNAHICLRQHHTLAELLPPAAFESDDRVLFFDPAAGNYTTLTHGGDTWLSSVLSMNTRPVAAHEAAMVQIRSAGSVIMYTGEVRLTKFVTPLVSGTQLIAPGWPVATPAPVTGLTSDTTPDTADRFRLWDGDTTPEASNFTGYYLDGSTTPPKWLPQSTPAPAATIQPFHGFFLIRTAPLQLQQSAPW